MHGLYIGLKLSFPKIRLWWQEQINTGSKENQECWISFPFRIGMASSGGIDQIGIQIWQRGDIQVRKRHLRL